LARLFTGPGLHGEFTVSSYFTDVELVWSPVTPVAGDRALRERFADTVAGLCVDVTTVGVSLSGGLDSLAVLIHVLALRPRRRVVAFVVDLVDDHGEATAGIVRQLLADLGVADRVELVVVDPAVCEVIPMWSEYGPRPDALPVVNATVAKLAEDAGVEVLLSGDGADELLAAPRFATTDVARRYGFRAAWRYLADVARTGPGVLGEIAAIVNNRVAPGARARMYWGANWPELAPPTAAAVLAPPWRDAAQEWACQWVDATIQGHVAAGRSWAEADAIDAWWPRSFCPPPGRVEEASPFLDEQFVAAALASPLAARHVSQGSTPYHRMKAQVVELFPSELRAVLPTRKRTYRAALTAAVAGRCVAPVAVKIGLLDADAVTSETDTATRMTIGAVEAWLAGAVEAGVSVAPRGRGSE